MTMESRIKPLPAPLRAGLLTPVCALCPCLGGPLAAWAWPGLPEPRWAEPHQKTPQGYAKPTCVSHCLCSQRRALHRGHVVLKVGGEGTEGQKCPL